MTSLLISLNKPNLTLFLMSRSKIMYVVLNNNEKRCKDLAIQKTDSQHGPT